MKGSISIPPELAKIGGIFRDGGFCAYLVGGAVRDTLMGRPLNDWDIATDATPEQVMSLFRKVIPTGIAHGTVTVRVFGKEAEVTTFRTEQGYSDGRHPDSVRFAATIEEDLSRRDFTMNAIAADLATGRLTDPYGGMDDIRRKIIRTVGNPLDRFGEDGLRPVRAIRFAGQLGFDIEPGTLAALSAPQVLAKAGTVSAERFRDEWCKMLLTDRPAQCLRLLESTGLMGLFIPEFAACRGCTQQDMRGYHEFDVADHTIYAVEGAAQSLTVRLAAFYHDIGKPLVRTVEHLDAGDVIHFHGHEKAGEKLCRQSMARLRFSTAQVDAVSHLVAEHMFHYESTWSDAAVRRFIIRVGTGQLEDLFSLRLADIYGMHGVALVPQSPAWNLLLELKGRIQGVLDQGDALTLKSLCVSGKDLLALGIPAGKTMGRILRELFETVTESPTMNQRDKLLALAQNLYAREQG